MAVHAITQNQPDTNTHIHAHSHPNLTTTRGEIYKYTYHIEEALEFQTKCLYPTSPIIGVYIEKLEKRRYNL